MGRERRAVTLTLGLPHRRRWGWARSGVRSLKTLGRPSLCLCTTLKTSCSHTLKHILDTGIGALGKAVIWYQARAMLSLHEGSHHSLGVETT